MTPSFMATEAKTRKAQDTERWESADEKEWQGLIRMGTFKIVPLSEMVKGERLYRTRFVRVEKSNLVSNGTPEAIQVTTGSAANAGSLP